MFYTNCSKLTLVTADNMKERKEKYLKYKYISFKLTIRGELLIVMS